MIPFLLTISFILHLITIFLLIIFYQKIKLSDQQDPKEFEHMFQQYLNEIRKENEQLQHQLNLLEEGNQQISATMDQPTSHENIENELPIDFQQEVEDELETSLSANILALSQKGYTPTEIAKKLNCGKTEAELIIKFYAENTHKA